VNLYAEAWDCPTASYGPGDSSLDHTPDERLSLAEFDRAVAVLTDLPDRL
jgi:LysW-gamma-L-lysine carboxypeptidase